MGAEPTNTCPRCGPPKEQQCWYCGQPFTDRRPNQPMIDRLRTCAADKSPNNVGRITIYPPEARELIALIDEQVQP